MKKLITTLLILFLSLGLFAETGYAGIPWKSLKEEFDYKEIDEATLVINKSMLGKNTNVYYHFGYGYLCGVSYSLPKEKSKELRSKYKRLIKEDKNILGITQEEFESVLIKGGVKKDNLEPATIKLVFMVCAGIQTNGNTDKLPKDGDAKLYVYDYNDDTRVYILEDYIEGQIFVNYLYHEQDY